MTMTTYVKNNPSLARIIHCHNHHVLEKLTDFIDNQMMSLDILILY